VLTAFHSTFSPLLAATLPVGALMRPLNLDSELLSRNRTNTVDEAPALYPSVLIVRRRPLYSKFFTGT
jgi:hypothetical protein